MLIQKLKAGKTKALKQERKIRSVNTSKIIVGGFYFTLLAVVWFSFMAWNRTNIINDKINGVQTAAASQIESINKAGFVTSPAGEGYSERFAQAYLNIPKDKEGREKRAEELQKYLAEGLLLDEVENIAGFEGKRILKDIELYKIADVTGKTAVYQYRVSYDLINVTEEAQVIPANKKEKGSKPQTKTVQKEQPAAHNEALLAVPIGTDGVSFNVIEQPYFKAVPVGSKLSTVEDKQDISKKSIKSQDELQQFTEQFFTSYTENTIEEMAYLMEKPESMKGLYQFKGLEKFAAYNGDAGQHIIKSLVVFTDASGLQVKQPVTLTVTKQNGKFFVKKIKHTIGG